MPSINRKQIRPRQTTYKHDNQSAEYYNSSAWHSLRSAYYMNNPLCECCMAHDVVKSAEHVHHRKPFLRGITDDERWSLLLEPSNLISVCSKCHSALHTKAKRYSLVMCDELTDKEYADAHSLSI
jgi:hypothetical protein